MTPPSPKQKDDSALAQMGDSDIERYARHIVQPKIGATGQQRLLDARVAIVGMGGIGCPLAQYLCAAGVGTLTLVDDDIVSPSNLSRQILFSEEQIDQPKVLAAASRLRGNRSTATIFPHQTRVGAENAAGLLDDHDLIIDGTDSHASRLVVSAAAHTLAIPLLAASVIGLEGQLAVFAATPKRPYAQIFPTPYGGGQSCADAGVLSPAAGMIGTMAASLALQGLVQADGFAPLDGKIALVRCWPPSLYWLA